MIGVVIGRECSARPVPSGLGQRRSAQGRQVLHWTWHTCPQTKHAINKCPSSYPVTALCMHMYANGKVDIQIDSFDLDKKWMKRNCFFHSLHNAIDTLGASHLTHKKGSTPYLRVDASQNVNQSTSQTLWCAWRFLPFHCLFIVLSFLWKRMFTFPYVFRLINERNIIVRVLKYTLRKSRKRNLLMCASEGTHFG